MAGPREILRLRFGPHCDANSVSSVVGRDTGRHAFGRIDVFAKCGSEAGRIDGRHGLQIETGADLRIEREADESAAMSGHEVDGFGRDFFGGDGEIAFVFAVLVIYNNEDLALAEIFNCFRD